MRTLPTPAQARAMSPEETAQFVENWAEEIQGDVLRRSLDALDLAAAAAGTSFADAREYLEIGVLAGFIETLKLLRETGLLP